MNVPRWLRWRSHAEIDEEIDAHLELEVQTHLDRGLPMDEARRAARHQFGNPAAVKQQARENDPLFRIESFVTDVRQTLRDLRRSPGFTIAAVLTLAVSIGATAAIFSIVDGVLLRPMPFPDPDRLVRVTLHTRPQANATVEMPFAELGFFHLLANNRTFDRVGGVSIFAGTNGNDEWALTGTGAPYPLAVARMTAGAFEVLGVSPQLGRFPTAAEDRPGGAPVLLLSDALWRTAFAASPSIVGGAVQVNGRPWEVIGVMPPSFRFPQPEVDIWIPFQLDPASKNIARPSIGRREKHSLSLVGSCTPRRAGCRLGGHRTERGVALGGRWDYVGADQSIGDIVLIVIVVFPAETGHSSRSLIACHPLEPERLWVAIEAGALVFTIDGGLTWRDRVPDGPWDTHELAVHRNAPDTLRVSAGDGYFESDDAGMTWRSPSAGLDVGYLLSVVIDPEHSDVVVVSASSGPHSAYVAGRSDGRLYRRVGYERWERVLEGWPESPTTIAPLLCADGKAGELWAADERGVHSSDDGGKSWRRAIGYSTSPQHLRGLVLLQ